MRRFWNWDIHYECNYRCTYCFLAGKWNRAAKENRYPGIEKWIDVWDKIYDKYGECHIHFSGGEPFIYPDFFGLIIRLSKKFTLEFSTNLSFDTDYFVKKMDPLRIKLNASFHPEFADLDKFLRNILLLKGKDFSVSVSFVAYPPHLKMMNDIRGEFAKEGVTFIVQPFRGEYGQRLYPDSYTEQDKGLINPSRETTPSSKTMFEHHLKEKSGAARLCHMGEMYGKIYACADVYRCCSTGAEKLGNLLEEPDFKLLDRPKACETENCACWKSMLVGEEDRWSGHWC